MSKVFTVRAVNFDEREAAKVIMASNEFYWVIISTMSIGLLYVICMYAFTMSSRTEAFRRRFMRQFDEKHKQSFG